MNKNKDWERKNNTISPVWNDGYQRYDLSIDEIIQMIINSGYDLKKQNETDEESEDMIYNDEASYILEIHSTDGNVVSETLALILQPRIYRNGIDITNDVDMKYFKWVRTSSDKTADAEWNLRHASGIKNLYITHEDVFQRAIFHCAFLTGASESQFVVNMYNAYITTINK